MCGLRNVVPPLEFPTECPLELFGDLLTDVQARASVVQWHVGKKRCAENSCRRPGKKLQPDSESQ